jgi:hypothetical protein
MTRVFAVALGIFAAAMGAWWWSVSLRHASFLTGWLLVVVVVVLGAIGIRRRLVMLPLGSVGKWVQIHIDLGFIACALYLLHVPRILATGGFEATISILVLVMLGSGFYGFYLSRTVPRRLTAIGTEVRYDQIPWMRARIHERATALIEGLPESLDRDVLYHHYRDHLQPHFAGRPSLSYFLFPSGVDRRERIAELNELHRYFSPELRQVAGELAALLRNRDDLDYHHVLQFRLRLWRAVHGVMTVFLLMGIVVHVVLVHRMAGD